MITNYFEIAAALLCAGIAFALARDLAAAARLIGAIDSPVPPRVRMWTTAGTILRTRIHRCFDTLAALRWQVESAAAHGGTLRDDPDFRVARGEPSADEARGDFSRYFERIGAYVLCRFRAAACAVVECPPGNEPRVLLFGSDEPALMRELSETARVLPHADESSIAATLFERYGYSNHMTRIITCEGGPVLIWLGYRRDTPPAEIERRWADELASEIGARMLLVRAGAGAAYASPHAGDERRPGSLAQLSHDIRSPLGNIRSVLSLLKLERAGTESSELVDIALGNCDSLGEIVDGVIDLAKCRAGRLQTVPAHFRLDECVKEAVDAFCIAAKIKDLSLTLHVSEGPHAVTVDRTHTRRIITNLVSNALKYTHSGGVSIHVRGGGGECSRVIVTDTGVGMSDGEIRQLFSPFVRFERTEAEGSGLGLTIVRALSALNNIDVQVRSVPNIGSEFELVFPQCDAASAPRETRRRLQSGAGSKVLLLDDDADCVESLARHLQSAGFEVFKTNSLADAQSVANFARPDFVVTDWSLGGAHGGAELLAFLSERAIDSVVIVLSGNAEDLSAHAAALGAYAVLAKGARPERLIELLTSCPQQPLAAVSAAR